MTLRELTVVLGLKVDHQAFEALDRRVDSMKENFKHLAEIAVAQVGALVELTRETAKSAVEAYHMGQSYGMSAQAVMKLKYAAEMTETPIETMQMGLRYLANNAVKASQGSAEAAAGFDRAGISIYGAGGKLKSTDQLLVEISAKFSGMKDGIEKTALASELLGARGGSKLIPFLDQGPDKIRAFGDEAQRLGLVIDESGVEASERLVQSWTRLMGVIAGLRNVIGVTLIPVLQGVIDKFMDWYNANRQMVQSQLVEFFREAATEAIQLLQTVVKMAAAVWKLIEALGGMSNVLRLVVAGFVAWTAGSTIMGILQLIKTVMMLRDAMIALGISEAIATGGLSLIAAGIGAAAVGTYMYTSGGGLGDRSQSYPMPTGNWSHPAVAPAPSTYSAGGSGNSFNPSYHTTIAVDARGAAPGVGHDIAKEVKKAMDDHYQGAAAPLAAGGVR